MSRLTEKYVQRIALEQLVIHYEQKRNVQAVVSREETGVKKASKLGYGRADGLIVAKLSNGENHTVSLEAKSSRTIFNINPLYKNKKWLSHAILVGVLGLTLTKTMSWTSDNWFIMWVLPLLVFIVTSIAFLLATNDFSYYRPISVISQVKRYPANEQWVAISTDVYNQLSGEEQEILCRDCRKQGIGLLRVSAGAKIKFLETAKSKKTPRGYKDFLECYARESVLREELWSKSRRDLAGIQNGWSDTDQNQKGKIP